MCWNLFFKKNAGLQPCNFIKKRLEQGCFFANTDKFLENTYFEEHLWTAAWLETAESLTWKFSYMNK